MKKNIHLIGAVFATTLFWVVLNEKIELLNIIIGIGISLVALIITRKFILKKPFSETYRFNFLFLVKFYLYLIYKIFSSGFQILPIIIKGEENNTIIDIKTELDNELYIALLANAITLTPGTITVGNTGKNLKVLWINPTTDDSEKAGEIIKGDFERLLIKASKKSF
ncbi:Na+/H+ antiporter subunit E [Clostridium grantii]|uniref:Multicomponent Na+:H+ antiporter subunit E n=1 Tax=Clostridium grantii DSM 8605 TaxID=1121316 RepID=A0A1M5RM54_9CLOT|nr:Na+/H+ antiporter subunit E [Clostridium grantii]SHH27417.1 multicomponent Na+:H+ antiporter subunit E [Clostridium grantii DSM 8605]